MVKRYNTFVEDHLKLHSVLAIFSLLFLWFILTVWYIVIFDQSILVISYGHKKESFTNYTQDKLLKGDFLSGEFTAADNNLGIVALRFKSTQRVQYEHEDSLLFRLKEKGQKNWYYSNTYRSGFIYDIPFLPFGFPIIHKSKGKTYQFELISLKGNSENGVMLSKRAPILATKYQTEKQVILHNPKELLTFAVKKFFNSFQTIDISFSSFVFALPLFFYIVLNSSLRKRLPKYGFFIFLTGIVLIDVLFLQILNDLLYVFVPLLYFALMRIYKLTSNYSYYLAFGFLLLSLVFLSLNNPNTSQHAGAFAYVLLTLGVCQSIAELHLFNR